jgi:hypothetical protein
MKWTSGANISLADAINEMNERLAPKTIALEKKKSNGATGLYR